jgi:hypothetical protein
MRYEAAVSASGLSDEQIATAFSSRMWDMVSDNLRWNITDTGTNTYDLALGVQVITVHDAAKVFAADYRDIAEDRLLGFTLVRYPDDGDENIRTMGTEPDIRERLIAEAEFYYYDDDEQEGEL